MKKLMFLCILGVGTLLAQAGEVRFKGEEILVDGKPFLIRGGEMHPQRIPRGKSRGGCSFWSKAWVTSTSDAA